MDLGVLLQIWAGSEGFVAVITNIGTVTRMQAGMSDQIAYLGEGFGAPLKLAGVRFHLVMDPLVLLQRRILYKGRLALFAVIIKKVFIINYPKRWVIPLL